MNRWFVLELFRMQQPRQRNSINQGSEGGRGIWFGKVRDTGEGEVGTGLGKLLPAMCGAKERAVNSGGSKEPRKVRVICSGGWYGFE